MKQGQALFTVVEASSGMQLQLAAQIDAPSTVWVTLAAVWGPLRVCCAAAECMPSVHHHPLSVTEYVLRTEYQRVGLFSFHSGSWSTCNYSASSTPVINKCHCVVGGYQLRLFLLLLFRLSRFQPHTTQGTTRLNMQCAWALRVRYG